MSGFQVEVWIELKDSDTGKVITWDTDTFYCDGDLSAAQALFDRICDGAGKAATLADPRSDSPPTHQDALLGYDAADGKPAGR